MNYRIHNFFFSKLKQMSKVLYGKKNTKDLRLLVLEKKSLPQSAVGDPVQDPEIVPSKKSKIESNMPLTRSKVCFLCGFNCFKLSLNAYLYFKQNLKQTVLFKSNIGELILCQIFSAKFSKLC